MQISQSSIMREKIKQMAQTREERARARRAMSKYTLQVLNYIFMSVLAVFFLFPIVVMVVSSFKSDGFQLTRDMGSLLIFIPYGQIDFQNYIAIFQDSTYPFWTYMGNSILTTVCIVVLGLFVNSLIGYALARLRFAGRGFILVVMLALMIVPFETVSIPLLLLVNRLPQLDGTMTWMNSYEGQIIPFIADAYSIMLFYQFFLSIPRELEEAALVDGASYFRIFREVVFPLSRPVFATVAIWQFVAYFGSYLWPFLLTSSSGPDRQTLMIGMNNFFTQPPVQWGQVMAFATMATLPTIILFLALQKFFMRSLASTGIKG
jgi:multiple sugar transport system permease protein